MNFFLLDKQQNIVKLLPEKAIIEAKLEEGINTAAKLNLTVDYTSKIDNSIFYLCVPTDRDDDSFLMLKIISETVHDKQVDYICMESAYDELSKYAYIKDLRPQNETAGQLVNTVLKDTRWTLGYAQETDTASMNFYYQTVLECLQKIVKEFDVELEFDVYIDSTTNKINRRQVNVYAQMGRRTGKRFEYGSNLLSVKREESSDTIFTAIVGRGSGVQNTDDQGNITGGYTRRITFADVEWSKAKGDPLDKPKGQEWLEDPEATAAYGFSDGKPRIGLQVFEDVKDPNELLKATYESLKQAKIPKVQFSASVLDVGDLHLGDTVAIIRHDVGIEYFTRVFKVTRDLLDKNNNKVEFGDNLTESTSITAQISKIENVTNKNSQNIGVVMNAANGKNKVFYTNKLPETADKGDICYLDLGNGETAMYIWDKGWHLVVSTKDTDAVKNQVEEAQKGIDDAKKSANDAVSKADGLIAQVGDANVNAQRALDTANQNKNDLEKAKNDLQSTNGQVASAISNISQAQEDIKSTEQSLQGVKSDLTNTKQQMENDEKNLSDLTKKAQEQGQTIVDIQKTQSGLTADIADVKGNVSSLQDTANGLQATVKDNQGNISKLQETSSRLQATIKDNQGNISKLQGTANSLQSSVQNNTNDISNIRQTANEVQSTVSNMQNVGQNLIVNSNFKQGEYHWNLNGWTISKDNVFRNNKIVSKTQSGLTSPNWSAVNATDFIPVHHGQKISIGVWVKASDVDSSGDGNWGASFGVEWFANTHSGRNHWNDYDVKEDYGNHDWRFLKLEGLKVPNNSNFARAHFFITQNGTAQFALPIMVYGDTLPAWSPSPLDSATASDMSSVEQTIDGLKSTVQSHTGDISQLKQTAQGLESDVRNNKNDISSIRQTADKVQSTISNLKVGGTNLLPETQNYAGYIHWGKSEVINDYSYGDYVFKPQTKIIHLYGAPPLNNALPTPDNKPFQLTAGKQYTFSAYVWHYGDEESSDELVNVYANFGNDTLKLAQLTTTLTNKAMLYHTTFTAPQTGAYTRFRVVHLNNTPFSGGSMFIAEMKLEEGNIPTDWSPSPFDLASQNDISSIEQTLTSITTTVQSHTGDISQLRQKADGLTSQIGNANNDISSLKQRADSLESNISNANNDISSLRQTANSLQSSIQNKADVSQVTQMADVLQSTVGAIGAFLPNGNFTEIQLDKDYMPWDTTKSWNAFSVVTDNPDWGHYMQLHGFPGTVQKIITKEFIRINSSASVIYTGQSLVSWTDSLTGSFMSYIHFYDNNKNEIQNIGAYYKYDHNNTWQDFRIEVTPPGNAMYIRIESTVDASKSSTDIWCALRDLAVQNGNSSLSSKITQMQDDINLRVQKGDLISQINIEAGKTLIQSKNLYLDSDTVTFSGRAFIPSAAITDLSADKITTGTLNAANVNVINMNVANLVGDTTSFVKSQWNNAYGSNVTIDGGGMSVHYGDWDTAFNSGGVGFNIGGDDMGGFSIHGMDGMPSWYQGLALTAGSEAEFFTIGAKDYHNANQNPIPPKLLWMRGDINGAGYHPGWNFLDDVWAGKVGIGSIQFQDWNISFGEVSGDNGFKALTLTSSTGDGFYWGSDGSFGFVTGGTKLYNVRGSQIVNSINGDGTCQNWTGVD